MIKLSFLVFWFCSCLSDLQKKEREVALLLARLYNLVAFMAILVDVGA